MVRSMDQASLSNTALSSTQGNFAHMFASAGAKDSLKAALWACLDVHGGRFTRQLLNTPDSYGAGVVDRAFSSNTELAFWIRDNFGAVELLTKKQAEAMQLQKRADR